MHIEPYCGKYDKQNKCAVMKKFFVKKEFRSQKIGLALYNMLIEYAKEKYIEHIILDTRQLRQLRTGFMERIDLNELSRRNYLYRTVCYICLINRLSGNISNYNHRKEVYIWNYRQ